MKIAVSSEDFRRVSEHAGRARRWLLFEGERGGPAVLVDRIEVPAELVFHHFKGREGHPLDGIAALITRSAGDNLLARLRRQGVDAVVTRERDGAKAAADYLMGSLAPPPPPGLMRLLCKLHDLISKHE